MQKITYNTKKHNINKKAKCDQPVTKLIRKTSCIPYERRQQINQPVLIPCNHINSPSFSYNTYRFYLPCPLSFPVSFQYGFNPFTDLLFIRVPYVSSPFKTAVIVLKTSFTSVRSEKCRIYFKLYFILSGRIRLIYTASSSFSSAVRDKSFSSSL